MCDVCSQLPPMPKLLEQHGLSVRDVATVAKALRHRARHDIDAARFKRCAAQGGHERDDGLRISDVAAFRRMLQAHQRRERSNRKRLRAAEAKAAAGGLSIGAGAATS